MLEVAIRAFSAQERTLWKSLLPYLSFTYNNTPHSATGYMPQFLLMGYKALMPLDFLNPAPPIKRDPVDIITSEKATEFLYEMESVRLSAMDALFTAQQRFKKNYDKSHRPLELEAGDQVLINIKALQLPETKGLRRVFTQTYDGPFEVME